MAGNAVIRIRRDTAANWSGTNPTLALGEVGFETDTLKLKVGNGASNWNSLNYVTAAASISSGDIVAALGYTPQDAALIAPIGLSGSAADLSAGIIPDARMPDLTGDVITTQGAVATTIGNDKVTYAKMQNTSAASILLGRGDSGAGDPQEITLGTNLTMSGTTLNAAGGGGGGLADGDYGDITVSGTGTALTIDSDVVSLAKMADVATGTVFYRKTAGTGDPEVQTLATLKTDLGLTGTNSGDQFTNMATSRILGRATAGSGAAEELTAAQAKTILSVTFSDVSGLGTAAQQNTGTSGANVPLMNGTNTWSGTQNFGTVTSGRLTASSAIQITNFVAPSTGVGLELGWNTTNSASMVQSIDRDAAGQWKDLWLRASTISLRCNSGTGTATEVLGASPTGVAVTGTLSATGAVSGSNLSGTNTGDQTITLTGDVTGSGTGSFAATIGNDKVTYAKMQNISATDRILGRSTAGAGDVEEITCTAAGRALIDDADAAAQRTTLGLGTAAVRNIHVGTTAPGSPATNDLWVDTN